MDDILINPNTGDVELSSEGDLQLTDSVMQRVIIRLKWFLNEWKMNRSFGIDYYGEMFKKNPNLAYIQSEMVRQILSTEGVNDVLKFNITTDSKSRTAYITFTALINGEIEEGRINVSV